MSALEYALKIDIDLQTDNAFAKLDELSKRLSNMNIFESMLKALTSAADKMNTIGSKIEDASPGITDIQRGFGSIFDTVGNIAEIMRDSTVGNNQGEINKLLADGANSMGRMVETAFELRDTYSSLVSSTNTMVSSTNAIVDVQGAATAAAKDNADVQKTIRQLFEDQLKVVQDLAKAKEDTDEKAINLIGIMQGNFAFLHKETKGWSTAAKQVYLTLMQSHEEAEKFVQTNYRAYGSQMLLLSATRELSSAIGVSSDKSIEIYKTLSDMRTPRDEMRKYAETIAMAERTTGASIKTLSIYTARMRAAGFSSADTSKQLANLTEAMRKFGVQSEEVNSIIQITADNSLAMRYMYDPKEIPKMQEFTAALVGIGKQAGVSAEAYNGIYKAIADPRRRLALMNMYGDFKNVDELQNILFKMAEQYKDANDELGVLEMRAISSAYFGDENSLMGLVEVYKKIQKDAGGAAINVKDFTAALKGVDNTQVRQYNESMENLYKATENLKNSVMPTLYNIFAYIASALTPFVQLLADGFALLSKLINLVIEKLYGVEEGFKEWFKSFEMLGGYADTAANLVVGGLKLMILYSMISKNKMIDAFIWIGTKFISMAGIFGGYGKKIIDIIRGMTTRMFTFGRTTATVTTATSTSWGAFFSTISTGLTKLSANFKGILGLSVLLLSSGAAALMFAKAVKMLNESGENSFVVFAGMVAAVGGLAVALLTTAAGAEALAPGMGLLAVVLAAAGAAAVGFGYGAKLASDGISKIIESLDKSADDISYKLFNMSQAMKSMALDFVIIMPSIFAYAALSKLIDTMSKYVSNLETKIKGVVSSLKELRSSIQELDVVPKSLEKISDARFGVTALAESIKVLISNMEGFMSFGSVVKIGLFTYNIDRIREALSKMGDMAAIGNIKNVGLLASDLDKLANMRVDDIVGNIQKISTAINEINPNIGVGMADNIERAAVALSDVVNKVNEVQNANIRPIIEVKVVEKRKEEDENGQMIIVMKEQSKILDSINSKIDKKVDIGEVVRLLKTYLPELAMKDNNPLTTALGAWR